MYIPSPNLLLLIFVCRITVCAICFPSIPKLECNLLYNSHIWIDEVFLSSLLYGESLKVIQSFSNDFTPKTFILPLSRKMFHDKGPKCDFLKVGKSQVSSGNCCLINNTTKASEISWNFGDFEITITVKRNLLYLYNSKLGYLDASVFQISFQQQRNLTSAAKNAV